MPKKGYVMLSGGVDSSVASFLLQQQGYQVYCIYMKCWSLDQLDRLGLSRELYACNWEDDLMDARSVAKKIGADFEVWDFQDEYLDNVVDYMIREYKNGRTPNPDVMCNSTIKFGIFYERAISVGADFVASGHYARMGQFKDHKAIFRGVYPAKDQSYFLWKIKKDQLDKIIFPIGDFKTKQELRSKALSQSLITANKKDSQGLCFVGKTPLRELLIQKIGKKPGYILQDKVFEGDVTKKDKVFNYNAQTFKVLGNHSGAFVYTIGQREKLGLSGGPWFVSRIDIDKNLVFVVHGDKKDQLETNKLKLIDLNYQVGYDYWPKDNLSAQIRYHGEVVECSVNKLENQDLVVNFKNRVKAASKGQSVVFYHQDIMLGGGVIQQVF